LKTQTKRENKASWLLNVLISGNIVLL